MTEQPGKHSKLTSAGPRRRDIALWIAAALACLGAQVWISWPPATSREAAGVAACGLLTGWFLAGAAERVMTRSRVLRRLREDREANTGSWRRGSERFTVRWEPSVGFYVAGQLGGGADLVIEEPWGSVLVRSLVVEQEADGFVPHTGVPTRQVRERLGIESSAETFRSRPGPY